MELIVGIIFSGMAIILMLLVCVLLYGMLPDLGINAKKDDMAPLIDLKEIKDKLMSAWRAKTTKKT